MLFVLIKTVVFFVLTGFVRENRKKLCNLANTNANKNIRTYYALFDLDILKKL